MAVTDITRTELRAYAREYYDLDATDLPDRIIDRAITEGWGKIIRFRRYWPGYETASDLAVVAGTQSYPSPLKEVTSIDGPDRHLERIDHEEAIRRFIINGIATPNSNPVAYSIFAGKLYLWPTPITTETYSVLGYRAAIHPLEVDVASAIDLPSPDAGEMLANWVMYRVAQHEDEPEAARDFLDSFTAGMGILAKDELDAPVHGPIVMNGARRRDSLLPDRLRYADGWE